MIFVSNLIIVTRYSSSSNNVSTLLKMSLRFHVTPQYSSPRTEADRSSSCSCKSTRPHGEASAYHHVKDLLCHNSDRNALISATLCEVDAISHSDGVLFEGAPLMLIQARRQKPAMVPLTEQSVLLLYNSCKLERIPLLQVIRILAHRSRNKYRLFSFINLLETVKLLRCMNIAAAFILCTSTPALHQGLSSFPGAI